MNKNKKKKIIKKVKKIINNSIFITMININKINSNLINELRKESRKIKVKILLIQNNLFKIACIKTNYEYLKNDIYGNNIMCFSKDNPGLSIRLFKKFEKKNKNFKIKLAAYEGNIIKNKEIDNLANLPTLEEILSKLIWVLKEISLGKFIRVLNNLKKKKINSNIL
ncbi:hypothetical protein SSAmo_0720 [Enterobacterales bacterium endosymbiont of Anomoneura mori]|uniref:50S ribosomal protein L10 n=1 Tax=Enterobacterales bacterium endosymbiont of Anomoneura mori TaxID=3132096 RepID=UPI00399C7854